MAENVTPEMNEGAEKARERKKRAAKWIGIALGVTLGDCLGLFTLSPALGRLVWGRNVTAI